MITPTAQVLPQAFVDWLVALGLCEAGAPIQARPLQGGVSSDIWQFELKGKAYCVKRALNRLKVQAHWEAPLSRNAHEANWLRFVHQLDRRYAPPCLANDPTRGMLLMPFLPASEYELWKTMLFRAQCTPESAGAVGYRLAHIHSASASHKFSLEDFVHPELFTALRLEPYLIATAARHPDLSDDIMTVCERTANTALCLIHGDISPKNIMIGIEGPLFLDAECACLGDPAFDVAFCLNHLLLKRCAAPEHFDLYRSSFSRFIEGYRQALTVFGSWEHWHTLEQRIAALLPVLSLARVDGKSPVEYIQDEPQKAWIRKFARHAMLDRVLCLESINQAWRLDEVIDHH